MRKTKATDAADRDALLARLRSVEGHVRGVAQMVERDAYCIDVLRQISAVQAALEKVGARLLDRHLHHCVSQAIRSSSGAGRERVLGELLDVFEARGVSRRRS